MLSGGWMEVSGLCRWDQQVLLELRVTEFISWEWFVSCDHGPPAILCAQPENRGFTSEALPGSQTDVPKAAWLCVAVAIPGETWSGMAEAADCVSSASLCHVKWGRSVDHDQLPAAQAVAGPCNVAHGQGTGLAHLYLQCPKLGGSTGVPGLRCWEFLSGLSIWVALQAGLTLALGAVEQCLFLLERPQVVSSHSCSKPRDQCWGSLLSLDEPVGSGLRNLWF